MVPRLTMASRWIPNQEEREAMVADEPQPHSGPVEPSNGHLEPSVMPLGGWQMHRARDCRARRLAGIDSVNSARFWLQSQCRDPFAMNAMRSVLLEEGLSFPESRLRNDDVISQVAHLIGRGLWHVCEPVMRLHPITASPEPASSVFPVPRRGPAASPSSSAAPPPWFEPPVAPTMAPNADHAATAAVLTSASQSGVPFCEECAKAAARMAAARMQPSI